MVKSQITITIESELLEWIEDYKKRTYPGLSRSAVIELLLMEARRGYSKDISVVR